MHKDRNTQLNVVDKTQEAGDEMRTVRFQACLDFATSQQVVEAVREALVHKPSAVLLDLAEVPLIDSSGLRALLQAKKLCEDSNARFWIESVSTAVARVIAMSGLAYTFSLPDTHQTSAHVPEATSKPDLGDYQWKVREYVAASDPSVISDLRERATLAASDAGVKGDDLCDVQIAVGEALTNAYRHGSPNKGVSKISMRCLTCPKGIVVEIIDEGEPFDPNNTVAPDPQQLRDHGMGIYLIRQPMDVVEFCCDCPGNRVRMIKWF